ncbi:TolC family protein [Chitinophaga caseinilytica]|uniref:TolC family protein n=1 Tax=Chitinophaga caseinilytica TaxID=2267521 RepID=A0ABZ2Z251_9BACT
MVRLALLPILLFSGICLAQQPADTLRFSPGEAEKTFLENNLGLLAAKLDIGRAEARILQAKAWPNPNFTLDEVNLWATARQRGGETVSPAFPGGWGTNQQFALRLEQMVQTARKRGKAIRLETDGKVLAEKSFSDLLQAMRAELRQAAAELSYAQALLHDARRQQSLVDRLLRVQEAQSALGAVPKAEVYRLRALQQSLKAEANEWAEQAGEKEMALKLLLGTPPASALVITIPAAIPAVHIPPLDSLLDVAERNNASLQVATANVQLQNSAYALERARRVPDLQFNVGYDRNGSTMLDFVGAGVSMDLPFFNRNKGNIRDARLQWQQSGIQRSRTAHALAADVVRARQELVRTLEAAQGMGGDYLHELDLLLDGITLNFRDRHLSLVAFLDYFTSFRDNRRLYYEAIRNIIVHQSELEYLTGNTL